MDKDAIDKELVAIQRDLKHLDRTLQLDQLSGYFSDFDIFFKSCRIKILYCSRNYVKIKLRTLLERYGYKRRSSLIIQYIKHCLTFYNLQVAVRGGDICDIETVEIDEMLMFRVIS